MEPHNDKGFNVILDEHRIRTILPLLTGDDILEVGSASGHHTTILADNFKNVTAIEPLKEYFDEIPNEGNISKFNSKLEEIQPNKKYDSIIVSNVLEHLEDTTQFLSSLKNWGNKNSKFVFVCPNARSVNRKVGVEMGLLETPYSLSNGDVMVGHKYMYSQQGLVRLLEKNGFVIEHAFTSLYKPFPNDIMITLPKNILDFCKDAKIGHLGAEIFVLARLE